MYSKSILAVLVALGLAALAVPASAGHVPSHNEFIAGGFVPGVGVGLVLCEGGNKGDSSQPTEYGVGGACLLTHGNAPVVHVVDGNLGGWDFLARCGPPGGPTTEGTGSAPNPCPIGSVEHVVVFVAVGATAGCTWVGSASSGCPK